MKVQCEWLNKKISIDNDSLQKFEFRIGRLKKDGFKVSLMTRTSDTVRTHLQRYRTLGEGLLKLCAHQSPYTGRTHRLFPSPQAASVHPRFEPTATPPSRVTSRGCYRYANPPPQCVQYNYPHSQALSPGVYIALCFYYLTFDLALPRKEVGSV